MNRPGDLRILEFNFHLPVLLMRVSCMLLRYSQLHPAENGDHYTWPGHGVHHGTGKLHFVCQLQCRSYCTSSQTDREMRKAGLAGF